MATYALDPPLHPQRITVSTHHRVAHTCLCPGIYLHPSHHPRHHEIRQSHRRTLLHADTPRTGLPKGDVGAAGMLHRVRLISLPSPFAHTPGAVSFTSFTRTSCPELCARLHGYGPRTGCIARLHGRARTADVTQYAAVLRWEALHGPTAKARRRALADDELATLQRHVPEREAAVLASAHEGATCTQFWMGWGGHGNLRGQGCCPCAQVKVCMGLSQHCPAG